jgi:hypothetical protein
MQNQGYTQMNNEDLKKIAEKIINKMPNKDQDPEKFGSVIAILMVISIVLTVVRVIQECEKTKIKLFNRQQKYQYFSEQIRTLTMKRSWFTRMTIKKTIRRELSKEDYKNYGGYLMNAILDTGENLTENEIKTLVEATNA